MKDNELVLIFLFTVLCDMRNELDSKKIRKKWDIFCVFKLLLHVKDVWECMFKNGVPGYSFCLQIMWVLHAEGDKT